jgi:hypothetical protein
MSKDVDKTPSKSDLNGKIYSPKDFILGVEV